MSIFLFVPVVFCCLASCYTERFVIVFLFFLRIHPSKCLESVCFVMLELTVRRCRIGGQVKGGGRLTNDRLGPKKQNTLKVVSKQQHCHFDC